MRLVIVLVLSLTAVYNQRFQSGRPVDNPGNPRLSAQVQNPRIHRSPNPYYGLYNYLNASPFFNRQAAMTRRYGAALGVLRNPQQAARPTPTITRATATAPQRAPQRVPQRVPQRAQQRVPQRAQQRVPQRAPHRVPQTAQAVQRNVNPYGFGRGIGMFGALHGRVGGLRGLHGRNQDHSRRLDGIRRMYGAMAGSGWRSYGGSSGGKGSYYYPHTGSSGGHYGGSHKGSYYYRGGGGGHGNSGHGNFGHGHGHGHSYWRRR